MLAEDINVDIAINLFFNGLLLSEDFHDLFLLSFWFYSAWELSFVRIPCCDCIVAHPADRQHIVPSYLKITQNDKFSVKVEPFTGNPLCHPL